MAQLEVPDELLAQVNGLVGQQPDATAPAIVPTAAEPNTPQAAPLPTMSDLGVEADPFQNALKATSAQLEGQLQTKAKADAPKDVPGAVVQAVDAAGTGVMSAVFETKDFFRELIGQPPEPYSTMSDLERETRYQQRQLNRQSGVNAFVGGTAQFVTGMLGVGKVMGVVKVGQLAAKGGMAGKLGFELAKGGAAAAIAFSPHQDRMSALIEQFPALSNPVTSYLADNEDDTRAEGRLKNALEGMGMDLAIVGVLGAAVKVFKFGKQVADGDVSAAPKLAEAEADLAEQVRIGQQQAQQQNPTVGGSPAKLPEAPNLINQAAGQKLGNTEAQVIDNAVNGADPTARGLIRDLDNAEPKVAPLPGEQLVTKGLAEKAPQVDPAPGTIDITVRGGADSKPAPGSKGSSIGGAVTDTAVVTGQKPKAVKVNDETAAKLTNIEVKPKIETNGIGYKVITPDEMRAMGASKGIDSSNWLGAANRMTGEIYISQKVLELPPARQAEIIMHETGHVLEKYFVERLTGKANAGLNTIPPQLQAEMEAGSRAFRPEHWDQLDKGLKNHENTKQALTKVGKSAEAQRMLKPASVAKTEGYLKKPAELFADNFSMWKTRREEFGRIAPKTAALFDEHFAPWIDHDFEAHLGDLDALTNGFDAMKAPKVTEALVVPDEDVANAIVKGAIADEEAIAKYGSREAATAAGHRFAKGANIPYQKLSRPEEVRGLMDRVAAEFEADLNARKGGAVLSDARATRLATKMLDVYNEDPAQFMGALQAAGRAATRLQAHMEAAFAISEKVGADLKQLVKNNEMGNYAEFGGDANLAEAAVPLRLAIQLETLAQGEAMRSALGRGMRRLRGDQRFKPEFVDKVRNLSPEEAAKIILMADNDLSMVHKLLSAGWWDRWTRAAGSLYSNNLLWFWPTHVRNLLGNAWMLGTTPAMRAIGSFGLKEGGQDIRTAALREYRYMLAAVSDAKDYAVQAYLKGDSILNPYGNEFFRDQSGTSNIGMTQAIGFTPMTNVGDFLGNTFKALGFVFTQPNRVLGMSDEFMKQMSYRASIMSKASVEADKLNLKPDDYKAYVKRKLEDSFDDEYRAINQAALYDAQVRTFSQPLLPGTIGKSVAGVVGQNPILRLILPFVRTPVNLFRYAVKLTPGLQLAQQEMRQMLRGDLGPARQADAYGQVAMGGMLSILAWNLAESGLITGGPPPGPQQQKALTDTGWKPYAVRIANPDGSHTWLPFSQLDPPGMLLGLMADIQQIMKQGELSDATLDKLVIPGALAIVKNLSSKTYLQSINDALDAVSGQDPSAMQRFLGGVMSGMVPMSSALRGFNPDPYMRDAKELLEEVKRGIPGLSETLPPRRDYGGEPVGRQVGMTFTDSAADVADAENQRMLESYGYGLTPLVATPRGDVDLRKYKLPSGQPAFDRYQELVQKPKGVSKTVKEVLGEYIKSDEYARLPDGPGSLKGTKLWALQQRLDKYRDAAYKQLLKENPDLARATAASQQKVREAIRDGKGNIGAPSSALKQANKAFGL